MALSPSNDYCLELISMIKHFNDTWLYYIKFLNYPIILHTIFLSAKDKCFGLICFLKSFFVCDACASRRHNKKEKLVTL